MKKPSMKHLELPTAHRRTWPLLAALAFATPAYAGITFISADAGGDVAMYGRDQQESFDKSFHDRITNLVTRNYVAGYGQGRDPNFPEPTQGSSLVSEVFRGPDQVDIYSRTTARAIESAPWAYALVYAFYEFSVDTASTLTLKFQSSVTGASDSRSTSSATWSLNSGTFSKGGVFSDSGSEIFDLPVGSYLLDLRGVSVADIRSDLAGVATGRTLQTSFSITPTQQTPTPPQPPEPGHELPEPGTAFLLAPSLLALLGMRARAAARRAAAVTNRPPEERHMPVN